MLTTTEDWRTPELDDLLGAVLTLATVEEAAAFFRDLCTLRELEEFAQRWTVARLLDEGLPYREIAERTGASTATVTRISQWLRHGMGGYRLIIDRTKERL